MQFGSDVATVEVESMLAWGAEMAFYVLLLVFTIYTVFLAYHWFGYGNKKQTALLALAVYMLGAAVLFLTMALLLGNL